MSPTTTSESTRTPSNVKDTADKAAPKSSVTEGPGFTITVGNPEAEKAAKAAAEEQADKDAERAEESAED